MSEPSKTQVAAANEIVARDQLFSRELLQQALDVLKQAAARHHPDRGGDTKRFMREWERIAGYRRRLGLK